MIRISIPVDRATKARLDALVQAIAGQAAAAGHPAPSLSFALRQAMEAGLAELEKRHAVTPPTPKAKTR